MKNHLKRIAAPPSWDIDRAGGKYTIRPKAGAHPLAESLPLGMLIRDELNLASTLSEARKVLSNNNIQVDGKRRTEYRFSVGLFDVISVPKGSAQSAYRMFTDKKGRLILREIAVKESALKICKVTGKTAFSGKKIQLHLHDGKNIITEEKVKVGDSVLITLPKFEIKEVLPLAPKAVVFLMGGKHQSEVGTLKEVSGNEATFIKEGKEIKTAKKYLFVVGKDKPLLEIKTE
jgi:small subunit ribosomal protein S4e